MKNSKSIQSSKAIEFTDDEVTKMRSKLEEKDFDDDEWLEILKKMRAEMNTNSVSLGRLFLSCHDFLILNNYLFEKEASEKLKQILAQISVTDLRHHVEEYGEGKEYGSYYVSQNIRKAVAEKRKEMIELVVLFFRIRGDEE